MFVSKDEINRDIGMLVSLNYDLLVPHRFTLSSSDVSEIHEQVSGIIAQHTANKTWWDKLLKSSCSLFEEQDFEVKFPGWSKLNCQIQQHLKIKYDMKHRSVDFYEMKMDPIGILTELETLLLIPFGEMTVDYHIYRDTKDMRSEVSRGEVQLNAGDVLYVKPHTYLSSSHPQHHLLIIISSECDRCLYFFRTPKYDQVFLIANTKE